MAVQPVTPDPSLDFLEREEALRELEAARWEAAAGRGRIMLVSGEAGIGKTTLIERFTALHRASTRILWGACDALFTPRPLGPLHDIAAQAQGRLSTLLGTESNRTTLFAAVLDELQQRPTIAVFEDVHWADEATLDLLKFLGRRIQRVPSLLILTYRDDEIGLRHPLRLVIGDLVTSSATRRITLFPLSEGAVRSLVGNRPLDPASLYRQTAGNPFFVTEVLAKGTGGDLPGGAPQREVASLGGIPVTVREAVLARAARLSPSGYAVLEAAAVLGPRIEPPLLAEVTKAEASSMDECLALGMLIAQGDLLVFRHELARQTILEAISPQRRPVLHRLALEALRVSPATRADLARLAHHAEAIGDRAAVCEYAPAAARQAAAVKAHREAVALYALALRFADELPPAEHALLLEAYAQECNITDQRSEGIVARQKALDLWRMTGHILKQGENLALLMIMQFGVGQTAEAERVSRAAIELLETVPPSRELGLAYRIQAALHMLNRDVAEALAWGEKAIAVAERFNDAETLSGAYNAIGSAQIVFDYEQGRASLERSLAIARQAGSEMQMSNAYNNLGSASGEVYHFRDAERYLADGIALCLEYDLDVSRHYMQAWQALTHLHLGRWSEAAEAAEAVLKLPGVSTISRIMALLALGRLRLRRGDPGAAEALAEALVLAEQTRNLQRLAPVRAARAEAAWLAGDPATVLAEARAVYDLAVSKHHPWFTAELGFWRWQAGDDISLPEWAAQPFAWPVRGEWRSAAQAWDALGCPYEQALVLMGGDEAAQFLALEIFEQLGARPATELVRQKLQALPRRQFDRDRFGGLTAREREVARLIAQGKPNREIAEAMTVGVKTVETYVTRILNKLGFDSRVQIATWALDKGLGQPPPPGR